MKTSRPERLSIIIVHFTLLIGDSILSSDSNVGIFMDYSMSNEKPSEQHSQDPENGVDMSSKLDTSCA